MPSAAHLTVTLYLCSSGSITQGKSRALEGRRVSFKKALKRVRDGDKGVAGRNRREQCFLDEGSLICPPGKLIIFYEKEVEKLNQCPDLNFGWHTTSWLSITTLKSFLMMGIPIKPTKAWILSVSRRSNTSRNLSKVLHQFIHALCAEYQLRSES